MYKNIIVVTISAIILCFAAFNNRFPLLTTDTGYFINSGFSQNTSSYPATVYGLFIAHFSWGRLIWLIVFSQCLIVSLTLYYTFRYFTVGGNYRAPYLAFVFFSTFCMSASVISSTVAPDIFTSVTIITTGLLLSVENFSRRDFIVIATITVFSSGMRIDNLFIVVTITLLYAIRLTCVDKKKLTSGIQPSLKRVMTVLALASTTFFLIAALLFYSTGNFNIHNLLMFQVAKTNTFVDSKGNSNAAVKAPTIKSLGLDEKKFSNRFLELTGIEVTAYSRTLEQSETFQAIYRWYNSDVRECMIARQFQGWLTFTYLNFAQFLSISGFSCLAILVFVMRTKSKPQFWLTYICLVILIQVLVSMIFLNAPNCNLTGIIWLLPIPFFFQLSSSKRTMKNETDLFSSIVL